MEIIKVFEESFKKLMIKNPEILYSDIRARNSEVSAESFQTVSDLDPKTTTLQCSHCKVEFKSVEQQREHYKLDLHRYNLKQNLQGKSPLTEDEFNDHNDELSSISGSDSEEESTSETLRQIMGKIYIKSSEGQIFSIYRCLLADKKYEIEDVAESLSKITEQWTVLMLGGGHFAGAVFRGADPIMHKTFHCYTVRAGQGGAQSARDNKNASRAPKSAGASLRRQNEQTMIQHVTELVQNWSAEINESSIIFVRAPGAYNKSVLFGGPEKSSTGLKRNDPRIRTVPFSTRRATFKEVKRVHEELSTIEVYASLEKIPKDIKTSEVPNRRNKIRNPAIDRAKSRELIERPLPGDLSSDSSSSRSIHDEELDSKNTSCEDQPSDTVVEFRMEDLQLCFTENLEPFGDSLTSEQRRRRKKKSSKPVSPSKRERKAKQKEEEKRKNLICHVVISEDVEQYDSLRQHVDEVVDADGNTALHLASLHESIAVIEHLLDLGADVCAKNARQQTAYTVTQSKSVREVFKRYANHNPDKFNYNKAQIPVKCAQSDLTAEELAEKKRLQRKAKRDKEKAKKKEKVIEKRESEDKERFVKLSDREKRALAAERRILSNSGTVIARCFLCGCDMSGRVPFEYDGNRFCTISCLKGHRMKNPVQL